MEYVYAAMLIHKAKGKVDESTVKKVMDAAGAKVEDAKVKALVASLEGVNIDEVIAKAASAAAVTVAPTAAPASAAKKDSGEDDKKKVEDEKKAEEAAAAGLGALFG